jgi:hypothetical protein
MEKLIRTFDKGKVPYIAMDLYEDMDLHVLKSAYNIDKTALVTLCYQADNPAFYMIKKNGKPIYRGKLRRDADRIYERAIFSR